MSKWIQGKIKKLLANKRSGFIHKVEGVSEKDFYFIESNLSSISFEQLSEGMEVSFIPNISDEQCYANSIESTIPIGIQQSRIKIINVEKESGFILSVDGKRDIYFQRANLIDGLSFSSLNKDDIVFFEIRVGKDGFLSAINIRKDNSLVGGNIRT